MRHWLSGSFLVVIVTFWAMPVFAKDLVATGQHPVMVKGMHFKDKGEKIDFMHGGMKNNPPFMVATSDGGVIVFVGGKLKKFDKDLNLVKEVAVDPSLSVLKPDCPMMREAGSVGIQKKGVLGNVKGTKK